MKTVDKILLDLHQAHWTNNSQNFPVNDRRILASFCNQLKSGKFFTENQAKLLIKIFKENQDILKNYYNSDLSFLDSPKWSEPFRVLAQVRRIYTNPGNSTHFFVEYTFNKKIKEVLTLLIQKEKVEVLTLTNKTIGFLLTETNIYLVITALKNFRFEISENLEKFYREIVHIQKTQKNHQQTFLDENEKIQRHLIEDIGDNYRENKLLLSDRQLRYGYQFLTDFHEKTLSNSIALRKKPRVWIDSSVIQLRILIDSLIELKRFPIMIVLDGHKVEECAKILPEIYLTLKQYQKTCSVYFRLDNKTGQIFNKFISDNKLNSWLNLSTDTVVIDNSKLPKFFDKSGWYPKSVISFTNSFTNNKGTVWCDGVDLLVYYTDKKPMMADHYEIL